MTTIGAATCYSLSVFIKAQGALKPLVYALYAWSLIRYTKGAAGLAGPLETPFKRKAPENTGKVPRDPKILDFYFSQIITFQLHTYEVPGV